MLGALVRPVFAADNFTDGRDRLSETVARLDGRLGTILKDAGSEILALLRVPPSQWRKLRSTNPLERC